MKKCRIILFINYIYIYILMLIPIPCIKWVLKYVNNNTSNRCLYLLYTILHTRRRYKEIYGIKQKFKIKFSSKRNEPLCIINTYDTLDKMGLTDRFKGMILTSDYCRKNNYNHKIYHKIPFNLESYVESYDSSNKWELDSIEYLDSRDSFFLVISHLNNIELEIKTLNLFTSLYGIRTLFLSISGPVDESDFGSKFKLLFRTTSVFRNEIINFKKIFNLNEYYTISFRFANLLGGNYNEKIFKELSVENKQALIDNCVSIIRNIIAENSRQIKIFVTSDNYNFLDILSKTRIDNVYMYPLNSGCCNHIAFGGEISNDTIKKMMIEFFMIASANKAYQIKIGSMYNSGFPRYAASIGGVDYQLIDINI